MPDETVLRLRQVIGEILDPLIARESVGALLDFPSSVNVGDNAIWLGEEAYLKNRGVRIVYRSDLHGYSKATLRRRLRNGVICLHGGGNFGDIWEGPQDFRERVIKDFPDNRIVVFPQTIHFEHLTNLKKAARTFASHGGLTLLTRSEESFKIARAAFECNVLIAPDMAFAITKLRGRPQPCHDIIWLRREDHEAAAYDIPSTPEVRQVDWAGLGPIQQLNNVLRNRWVKPRSIVRQAIDAGRRHAAVPLSRTFNTRARRRVAMGIHILSEGRVVITDRLHGHILCMLLEIPHVLLDNKYGKISDFYETWTRESPLCRRATTPEEALDLGRQLLRQRLER